MTTRRLLSRRTMLRGLGAGIALPLLEGMLPAKESDASKFPTRMAFVYAPNGKHMAEWSPETEGAGF
jgi:hypothetical protein